MLVKQVSANTDVEKQVSMIEHSLSPTRGKWNELEHCVIELDTQRSVGNDILPHAPADHPPRPPIDA
jgi:hypothetical protein